MSDHTTSTRLIASAAREGLAPLGLRRLGRSRRWYDDRGWWVIHVEFQSSRSAGTYLNIGAMWLWVDKNFWTFDEGDRLYWRDDGSFTYDPQYGESGWLQFLDFLRVEQFSRDLPSLVQIAARRVTELLASDPDALQERILATIHATRQRLKLPPSVITAPTARPGADVRGLPSPGAARCRPSSG
ncbi:hypothetical protein [Micromonospora sp. NBC_01796]|uniref:hypothetical protein n=1 Tax=Micromonospora sp. NBC_01796 TaxID=2975987 RepID=UPI002DDBA86A|nr:hypothetical protein [Micromonospora sp. NBC_01796]WSA83103.1 hypothetical protein OIE47_22095 [Micromonospora sp. NBC_01796]